MGSFTPIMLPILIKKAGTTSITLYSICCFFLNILHLYATLKLNPKDTIYFEMHLQVSWPISLEFLCMLPNIDISQFNRFNLHAKSLTIITGNTKMIIFMVYLLMDHNSQQISMQEFTQLLTFFKVSKIDSEVLTSSLQWILLKGMAVSPLVLVI